ncbi:MAG TPA: hypothetical protein VFZ00_33655 [Solirubrobacter sp.]|nr:hypothetical protein [Solirubrobacter sp.]
MQHSDAQRWLSTWAIAVRDRDGMTWTAGKIAQVLSATLDGTWTLAYAQGSKEANPDPVAELSALVGGQKVLLQAAKRSRLTTGGSNPWLWAIPV